ncbi:hypothetical protein C1645_763606 [Glomus cerebriforme]|uniref:DNA endonuclease activator Ctp1 C-terminal domain-containing protein n=1 Tax=Glomus cerebriforme TaxID=658196 RepID=A0A397T972_9GLOM|nr:hypothetical protein C1645_763606 [Glomus cerebriforme]
MIKFPFPTIGSNREIIIFIQMHKMQNSSSHINASSDNTRETQTMSSNVGEQSFIPASMVQNILEWQRQALETIREQNKANQVTQQQNNTLLQRIDTLQQYIHNYKQDARNLDVMDLDNTNTEVIGTVEDIKENLGDNQFIPEFSSNDALFIKDNDGPHISLRQSPDMETERRHKKALEDLDNEWRDKYAQLQTKYDAQYKAYQELKEHYQKRSAEWKRVKKWLDEQKFVQKHPERTDQVNELTSKITKSKVQFEKSPTIRDSPFSNDSKTNSSGALADVTNMQNQSSSSQNNENVATNEHVADVNRVLILESSYNKDDIVFRQDNNRYSHNISSPKLFFGSMITNNLDKMQTNYCPDSNPIYCDQEWNEDHNDQPNNFDHDMANVDTEEKGNLLPSKGNENLGLLEGTTPDHAIDLEEGNYEFLFDEDPSLNKKRAADMVIMQENIENNELSSTDVTNKRYKSLTSKSKSKLREEFNEFDEAVISEDVTTTTPYNNRFKADSRSQTSADNMYEDNDIESANPLTPITPTSIKNKGIEKEFNNKNNNSKQGEGYRYIETIRKKNERRQLMAQDCRDCRKYYEMTGISLSRQCDHNQSSESLMQDRKQLISRHRAKYSRPQTPPGFWKVGFPTSQEIAEINELSVAYEREREEQKRREMEFAKSRERKWDNGTSK